MVDVLSFLDLIPANFILLFISGYFIYLGRNFKPSDKIEVNQKAVVESIVGSIVISAIVFIGLTVFQSANPPIINIELTTTLVFSSCLTFLIVTFLTKNKVMMGALAAIFILVIIALNPANFSPVLDSLKDPHNDQNYLVRINNQSENEQYVYSIKLNCDNKEYTAEDFILPPHKISQIGIAIDKNLSDTCKIKDLKIIS